MSIQQGINQILSTTMIGMRLSPNYERNAELRSLQREGEATQKVGSKLDNEAGPRHPLTELARKKQIAQVAKDMSRMSYRKAQLNPTALNVDKAAYAAELAMDRAKNYYDFRKEYSEWFDKTFSGEEV